ncbi:MAG: site-specific integrase [Paludibacteraceae bacterium]|nr:site-specific integrase [Paludibacteraceae bacterium]
MSFPTVRLVFDRKHKASNRVERNGKKGLVQLEITFNRKRKWIGTGVSVYKDQWDDGMKVINHMQRNELNSILELILMRAYDYIRSIESNNEPFEFSAIENAISVKKIEYENVSEAICAFIASMKKEGRNKSSVACYETMKSKFLQYGQISSFNDLSVENIKNFDHWMTYSKNCSVSESTRFEYHRKLSAVINWLVCNEVMKSNPYDDFHPKRKLAVDTIMYLNDIECAKLEAFDSDDDRLVFARDLFLFMRYTGMAFSDATRITSDDIEIRDGKRIVRSKRKKTGIGFMIVILDPAWRILTRYGGRLDRYSLSYIDQKLHIVGHVAIGRKITTHMARHTFACWALRNGVPVAYIARMIGHSNIETTQIYAEVLGEDIINESKKLENVISSNPVKDAKVIPMFGS